MPQVAVSRGRVGVAVLIVSVLALRYGARAPGPQDAQPDADPDAARLRLVAAVHDPASTPPDSVEPAPPPAALAPPEIRPQPSAVRVRVCVRILDPLPAGQPTPELLRKDAQGRLSPVPRPGAARRGPAARPVAGETEAAVWFEVDAPGRYVPAWSCWLPVAGTNTWRAARGQGPEFDVAPYEREREVVVDVAASQLALDPALDRVVPGAIYRVTPKDG